MAESSRPFCENVYIDSDQGYILLCQDVGLLFGENLESDDIASLSLLEIDTYGTPIQHVSLSHENIHNDPLGNHHTSCRTNDLGFIVAYRSGYGDYLSFNLIKFDQYGNTQWSQVLSEDFNNGNTRLKDIIQCSDDSFMLLKTDEEVSSLSKINEEGLLQWSQTFENETATSIQQTFDGGYVINFSSVEFVSDETAELIKIDHSGNIEWIIDDFDLYFDLDANCCYELYSTVVTSDGGFISLGSRAVVSEECPLGFYTYQKFLIKFDSNGNEEWSKIFRQHCYGTYDFQLGVASILNTTDEGFLVTLKEVDIDALELIYIDNNGIEEWSHVYDTYYLRHLNVKQHSDNGFIILGYGTDGRITLIKTDSEGTLSSSFTIPTQSPKSLIK